MSHPPVEPDTTRGSVDDPFAGHVRYQTLACLGAGSAGSVYRAYDRKLRKQVAAKLVHGEPQEHLARVRHCHNVMQRHSHPNVVRLHELIRHRGQWLLSMELVEGVDLVSHVRDGVGFNELRLRAAFSQLAQALQALHRERKVHRDVKPSNVRVTREGRVVLLDLDLIADLDQPSYLDEDSDDRQPLGTPAYMAPEQAAGTGGARATSDWYSFGAVLHEALTGEPPFRGSPTRMMMDKQHGPPPVSQRSPDAPPDLEQLVAALLDPDVSRRPGGTRVLRLLGVQDGALGNQISAASILAARRPLTGRDGELKRLHEAAERAAAQPVLIRVSGTHGTGKTALCEHFLEEQRAAAQDLVIFRTRCLRHPSGPHEPLQEIAQQVAEYFKLRRAAPPPLGAPARHAPRSLTRAGQRSLEKIFPGVFGSFDPGGPEALPPLAPDPLEQRWGALRALHGLLRELVGDRRVICFIDDYQYADMDTRRMTETMMTDPLDAPLLLLLAEDRSPRTPRNGEHIVLDGLESQDARALSEDLLSSALGRGNHGATAFCDADLTIPTVLEERVRYALFKGEVPSLKLHAHALVDSFLGELDEPSLHILQVLAIGADPILRSVCEQASMLERGDFNRQVSTLIVAGLVTVGEQLGEDTLTPSRPHIGERALVMLDNAQRVQLHRQLATVMVSRDPDRNSGQLLRHRGESGDHAGAATIARRAAMRSLQQLAFQRAAELFTLASSIAPAEQGQRDHDLLRMMAETLGLAGWANEAANVYLEAARNAPLSESLYMRQRAAEFLIRGGSISEGLQSIQELLTLIGERIAPSPRHAIVSLLRQRLWLTLRGLRFKAVDETQAVPRDLRKIDVMWSTGVQLVLVDNLSAADFINRSLNLALKVGEPRRVARSLCMVAVNTAGVELGDMPRTRRLMAEASQIAEHHPSPYLQGMIELAEGMIAISSFEMQSAVKHCRAAQKQLRAHCRDVAWEVTSSQIYELIALAHLGDFKRLRVRLEGARREAVERGDFHTDATLACIVAFSSELADDAPDRASEAVLQAMRRWPRERFLSHHFFELLALSYIKIYEGHPGEVLSRLQAAEADLQKSMTNRVRIARVSLLELRARARCAMLADSREKPSSAHMESLRVNLQSLQRGEQPEMLALGQLLQAGMAAIEGDKERALDALRGAVTRLEALSFHLWARPAKAQLAALLEGGRSGPQYRAVIQEMRDAGIRAPEKHTRMMTPGLSKLTGVR